MHKHTVLAKCSFKGLSFAYGERCNGMVNIKIKYIRPEQKKALLVSSAKKFRIQFFQNKK
jgi:hypothetical protein